MWNLKEFYTISRSYGDEGDTCKCIILKAIIKPEIDFGNV
jgi:hypothetical protein